MKRVGSIAIPRPMTRPHLLAGTLMCTALPDEPVFELRLMDFNISARGTHNLANDAANKILGAAHHVRRARQHGRAERTAAICM